MLVGGYGGVMWAEQVVPSGLTALIITVEPLWFVLFDWLIFKSGRPGKIESLGLLLGFRRTIALVLSEGGGTRRLQETEVCFSAWQSFWEARVLTSVPYSRKARIATSGLLGTAMEMLAGGVSLSASAFSPEIPPGSGRGETGEISMGATLPRIFGLSWLHRLSLADEGGEGLRSPCTLREPSGAHFSAGSSQE